MRRYSGCSAVLFPAGSKVTKSLSARSAVREEVISLFGTPMATSEGPKRLHSSAITSITLWLCDAGEEVRKTLFFASGISIWFWLHFSVIGLPQSSKQSAIDSGACIRITTGICEAMYSSAGSIRGIGSGTAATIIRSIPSGRSGFSDRRIVISCGSCSPSSPSCVI